MQDKIVFDEYVKLGKYLSKFNLIDSLHVMWAYSVFLQYNTPLPSIIEAPLNLLNAQDEIEKRILGLNEFEIEFLVNECILNCNEIPQGLLTLGKTEFLAPVVNDLRSIDDKVNKLFVSTEKGNVLIEFFRMIHKQIPWQNNNGLQIFYKYYKIFNYPELNSIVEKVYGLSVMDIQLVGLLFVGLYIKAFYINEHFKCNIEGITDEMVKIFMKHFSIKLKNIRDEIKEKIEINEKLFYSFNPLRQYPILNINENLICPIPTFLMWQTTSGIYYSLVKHPDFNNNVFGKAFENYIGEVIEEVNKPKLFNVFAEVIYGNPEKKTVDWLIDSDDAYLFVECKTKRVKITSKIELSLNLGIDDDLDIMAENILKSYKTIIDFKNGNYPMVKYDSNKKIFLLILTLEDWYISFNPFLLEKLKEKVRAELSKNSIDKNIINEIPYFIFSANQFEEEFQIMYKLGLASYFSHYMDSSLPELKRTMTIKNLFFNQFKETFIDKLKYST